jgi:hypothetical protein
MRNLFSGKTPKTGKGGDVQYGRFGDLDIDRADSTPLRLPVSDEFIGDR